MEIFFRDQQHIVYEIRLIAPPLTGPKPSTRKEEGCCQEGHPSVKVSQSRIMSFNSTTMNARASPLGDAVHTRPSGLTKLMFEGYRVKTDGHG